jgi:hypothetical protein
MSCPRNNLLLKFILQGRVVSLKTALLVFEDPVAHQVIYVRNHFAIGKAHLVPIEGLTEDFRGQFGNCLWSDLTTFGDLSAAIPMMLLLLLDSSMHTVKRGVVPGAGFSPLEPQLRWRLARYAG